MPLFSSNDKAFIMLGGGRVFEGVSFGAKGTAFGELVFTTGMVGYLETLTDPAYKGRVITQTFPLIGNYGVNGEDVESDGVHASGYVVREWCGAPSNFRSEGNIDAFMKERGVIGVHSVDTRCLTRLIRDKGVMNCVITTDNIYDKKDELLKALSEYKGENALKSVTARDVKRYSAEGAGYNVALLDLGVKKSVLNTLLQRGCNITVYPAFSKAEEILAAKPDGIFFSNGADNPEELAEIKETAKTLLESKIPSMGIDAGHILMALAMGADIKKLKHGHRGANQPSYRVKSKTTFVTSQNHAYYAAGIDETVAEVSFVNLNDKTCEGLSYKNIPAFSVQFIPEFSGGPQNPAAVYDEFVNVMRES